MEIRPENIIDPPEKMRLMFEAVSDFLKEQKDITALKVQDITARAGIGKGTAYEYFSSKDEIIANALMYEYSRKIQLLADVAFRPESFKERCFKIMDWIKENKEYNQMFSNIMTVSFGNNKMLSGKKGCESKPFLEPARDYIYSMIDKFMEEGYQQGVIKEIDKGKRSLALLSAMVEYSFVIMGPKDVRYSSIGEESIREFIYESLIRSLQ